jgi:ABC-2 type transport system permease protein
MLIWFWLNPILYPAGLVKEALARNGMTEYFWLYFLNPMATVVSTFQRAIYQTPTYADGEPHARDPRRRRLRLLLPQPRRSASSSRACCCSSPGAVQPLQADFAEDL